MYNQIPGQTQGERPVVWGGALQGEVGERLPCCYLPSWGGGLYQQGAQQFVLDKQAERKKPGTMPIEIW